MSKFVLHGLKPVDWSLLILGVLFALLLIAAWLAPMTAPGLGELSKNSVQPLGAVAFLSLGIFTVKTQKPPQRNFGYFLLLASAFAFVVSAVMLVMVIS